MSTHPTLPRIFITHSWFDIDFARRLFNDLKARGFDLWFDDKTMQAGHRMAEEINRGLEWCDVYIPVISQKALASQWCWEEINAAIALSNQPGRNNRPRIIPVITEECEIPALLASRLYINFAKRYDVAFGELLQKGFGALSPRLTPSPGAATLPRPPSPAPPRRDLQLQAIGIAIGVVIACLCVLVGLYLLPSIPNLPPTFFALRSSDTPEPRATQTVPTSNPLPGTLTIPMDRLAHSVPWLPLDMASSPGVYYYGFNVNKPPFHNRVVRQAFAAATDRQAISDLAHRLGARNARPATTFVPPETLGRDLYGQVGIPFNSGKARTLLANAGYPNGQGFPPVVLVTNKTGGLTSSSNVEIATAITAMWQNNLNVKIDVQVVDAGMVDYTGQLSSGQPSLYRFGWMADFNDPDNFLREVFHTDSKTYKGNFSNTQLDRLIEQAATASDPTMRQSLYIQAERILCEDQAAIIPLYHATYSAQ